NVILKNSILANLIERWSISDQFRDFSRGVVTLSSLVAFLGIVVLMLWLCMVLLGRRHWRGGSEGRWTGVDYYLRFQSLLIIIFAVDLFLSHQDRLRADLTSEGINSLSPKTRELLSKLDPKSPIKVYAYISKDVPESFVQTKMNLESTLAEIKAAAGNKIELYPHYL